MTRAMLTAAAMAALVYGAGHATIAVDQLRSEYLINPLGLDTHEPRFSWTLTSTQRAEAQSAYQILVGTSEQTLSAETGDKWDSGKIASGASVNIAYAGKPLASRERCYWKVRVWDKGGASSAWSKTAMFEIGLNPADWKAVWIGGSDATVSPLLRKSFTLSKPVKRARAYVAGLGWYELYLNGRKVGDHVLDPAMTNYDKRVLYVTYDVTRLLQAGANAVGVMLGNGWYSQPGRLRYGAGPKLRLQLEVEFADGERQSVSTDATWRNSDGPITRNGIQMGESYDATLEKPGWNDSSFDDSTWANAQIADPPAGTMASQSMPAMKVIDTLPAAKLTNPKPGVYVYDLGQVITGWARLHVKGPGGRKVTMKFSERLNSYTGLPDKTNHPPPLETDEYTLRGSPQGEAWEPRFTFHPFRYVQVEGYPGTPVLASLEGRVVHSAVDSSPAFESSSPLLNKIHNITFWTVQNSLYGMPIDEPHREPFAYLEAGETPANLYSRRFMPELWTKWFRDIQSEQSADGDVPVCVPNYPKHKAYDVAWSGNYPTAVWYFYQSYNDRRVLEEHYESMKRWVDYVTTTAENDHTINKGTWGDHMMPGVHPGEDQYLSKETPPALCWTGYYYRDAEIIAQAAAVLGKKDDGQRYTRLAEEIKSTLNQKWFHPDTDQYAMGSQTSNLFALALGIVPEGHRQGVAANVARDITEKYSGHLHTGIIGTTAMVEALVDNGYVDVMYRLVNRPDYPGWGYMVSQGGTTIWEAWGHFMEAPRRGETMTMFATIDEFMYTSLAGIRGPRYYGPEIMEPGYARIHIQPFVPAGLDHVAASVNTVHGRIYSAWRRMPNGITVRISIPVNTRAAVSVPKLGFKDVTVSESAKVVWNAGAYAAGAAGVSGARDERDFLTFDVGSGVYVFQLSRGGSTQ